MFNPAMRRVTYAIALCFVSGWFVLESHSKASSALLEKDPIQCVIKSAVIKNQRSLLGTNAVFFIAATIELVNESTNTFDIDRDSLVVALHTARLSDTNGLIWEIKSPLSRYRYHPLDTGQRDFFTLRKNSTNQMEVTLTSLDAPFVLVNRPLFIGNQSHPIPSEMFGSVFTTVLGRVDGQEIIGKRLLQGASRFGIKHQ
jgi:multisubunit Na+/H+ antiporter MnhE subunit